jgi:hypothetical protein
MVRVAHDVIACLHQSATVKRRQTKELALESFCRSRQRREEISYGTVFRRREEDPGASPQAY